MCVVKTGREKNIPPYSLVDSDFLLSPDELRSICKDGYQFCKNIQNTCNL